MILPAGARRIYREEWPAELLAMRKVHVEPGFAVGGLVRDRVEAANRAGAGITWFMDGQADRGDRWGSEHL